MPPAEVELGPLLVGLGLEPLLVELGLGLQRLAQMPEPARESLWASAPLWVWDQLSAPAWMPALQWGSRLSPRRSPVLGQLATHRRWPQSV